MNPLLYDLLQNFILGGLITASISYIGTYLNDNRILVHVEI